jgi:hypothetical protein
MAEFCTKCAPEMWASDIPEDINIDEIYESLTPGNATPVMCEGCMLMGIGKDENGEMLLAVPHEVDHASEMVKSIKWVTREEFMALPSYI